MSRFDSAIGPWWDVRVVRIETSESPLILASGPRDAEARLLGRIEDLRPREIEAFGPPIRIVVPSRSLRRHVLKVVADHFGAVVGIVVQTHRAMALEVLKRSAVELPAGGARLQDLLARRFAAQEEALRRDLADFDDGYAPVGGAVRDLLDAGFDPGSFETVVEAIQGSVSGAEAERAAAVVWVAAKCHTAVEALGFAKRGTLHQWATRELTKQGHAILPSRAVLIHGFAEATGLLSDFLEALVHSCGAQVIVDHPADPVRHADRDPGCVFTLRLTDHLLGPGSEKGRVLNDFEVSSNTISAFTSPGPEAEIREIVERIRSLLNSGVEPESIGVVFRRLSPSTIVAIRRHFGRHGIPFSGEGAQAPGGAPAREAGALADLLTWGIQARVESWLNTAVWDTSLKARELDLALRTLGAARLGQVAALAVEVLAGKGGVRLPVVEGVDEINGKNRRRIFARQSLEDAVQRAVGVASALEERPDRGTVKVFFDWVRAVLRACGRKFDSDTGDALVEALNRLEQELPEELTVDWTEISPLLMRALEGFGAVPIGGQGGGVQVLTVMEARGRTFEHIFVSHLNRGVFPVQGADDPVFSAAARRGAAQVLPDLPLKARDRPEERYLFAQLISAAPFVTLSWQGVDADGKDLNPSVFAERLRLGGVVWWPRDREAPPETAQPCAHVEVTPDVFARKPTESVRPLLEHAVVEGLEARGAGFSAAISRLVDRDPSQVLAVLDQLDPQTPRCDLGPFLGAVGIRPTENVWVTFVEALVACPWKTFLERILGLEPPPEASFSEEGLGGAIVGSVVHEVLEQIAVERGVESGRRLEQVRGGPAVPVVRPESVTLERITAEVARRKTMEMGAPALAPAVAELAQTFLERARKLAWPEGTAMVLGVETIGRADFCWRRAGGGEVRTTVNFRADRVDRGPDVEAPVLMDYKTGMPATNSPKLAIRRGQLLQAIAYVLGAGQKSLGRYVVLKDVAKPVIEIDFKLAEGVIEPAQAIFGSWAEGVFFPRLSGPDGRIEGASCRWCKLKSACLHGESGVRRRMIESFEAMGEDDSLRLMWELPTMKAGR